MIEIKEVMLTVNELLDIVEDILVWTSGTVLLHILNFVTRKSKSSRKHSNFFAG